MFEHNSCYDLKDPILFFDTDVVFDIGIGGEENARPGSLLADYVAGYLLGA